MLESSTEQLQKKPVNSKPETLIRVLHVDDDADFLKSSKRILEMDDLFQIETALSVKEALQKLRQKTFDVIVSDYKMPERNGLDLLKELRDKGNNVPFILFTGKGREEVAIEALNLGADRYFNKIGKPEVVYHELTHAIRKVMEIKEAEKALQKSEENYRCLFENAPVVILTLDSKGNVTSINKVAEEYGFKKDEIVGKNMRKFVPKRFWPKLLKDLVQLSRGKTVESKIEIDTPKGKKTARYKSNPIIIDNKVVGVQAVLTDITKRKKMEKQLKESEEKYRKQFEEAIDAIFLADAETGITLDCNLAATKLVGRKKSELVGKHQRILHPPEAIEGGFSRTFRQHRKAKKPQVLEDQIITKNGEIKDVIINATTFELEGKRLIQATFRDVTNKKKMEETLRRERETLELVTANIGAGLTIISKDYKILWANNFLQNICGEDLKGKTCYSVYADRTSVCPGCGVKEIFETEKNNVVHEQSVPGPGGQRVWMEITANPIRDKNGNIVAASELYVYVNERKQLENKLREAEKRYHAIFDKAPLGILIIDSTGTAVEFNEEAHRQLGYSRDEFAKLTVFDYEVLENAEETRARMERTMKTGKDEFETKHRTKTGEIRDIKNTIQVIELSGKKFFQVITRDITERKRAEEALRESEEKYRELLNGMNDTAWVIDSDCSFIDVNNAAVKALGYSREELLSMKIFDIDFTLDPKKIKTLVKDMPKDTVQIFQTAHTTKNGKTIPVEISSSLITYMGKQAILSVARNLTERKQIEQQLKESEEKYRKQFEEAIDAIVLADAETGIIVDCNRAATELVGRKKSELIGKHQRILHPPEEIKGEFSRTFKNHRKEKEGQVLETQVITKTGEIRDVAIKANILELGDKKLLQGIFRDISEQKRAEEALRESEEKYRELLNGMNDTAWVIDLDGKFIDVNDAAVEVLGYSREELLSMGPKDLSINVPEEDVQALIDNMPKDEIQIFEATHFTKDGRQIPVEISSSLVTYKGKQAILSIARDITERKKAREELRQSKERYRTVFENTGTAMCILEDDKTISMVNRRFEELSGYSWKELEGKKWTEFVTKEYLERMKRYHEARRKKGGKAPMHYSFDFVNKNGQIKNCMLTINLIPGTKKSVASILDITESKKAEKALREADKKYRKTILSANVGIISYSPEAEVKILNPKMKQMTGFKRSEIPTLQDWFEKLYPNKEERRKIRDRWLKRMSEEGEVKEGQAIITTKDGKRRNFLFNAVRLESGDTIAFAEDITERKEAEEKLEEMMNELVAINEKLGVVGRLTRHDARNKLSVIANNVFLAKQKLPANHSSLEFLGDVESAIDQMEKIFDFARNYEMLGVEELSYMDVGKSVEEAAILLSGMNEVKLVNECRGLAVMADSLLRQLFYNLIDDTLKHGEKASQIRVYHEEGEDQLKLVYEDDGVGIPENEKELIFKEGYGKSTGYGLYLIKKMCEEYGWTIRETGKQGKGAQFTIIIPKTNKNGKASYRFDNK